MSGVRSSVAIASAPLSATMTSAWPRSSSAVIAKMLRKSSSTTRIFTPSIALSSRPFGRAPIVALPARVATTRLRDDRRERSERGHACGTRCRRRQPRLEGREELGGVDRLRNVVVGAGIDAALALAGRHLAGDGDDRERLELLDRPDGADGLVAVHDRHHDVHQDDVDVRLRSRVAMASAPLSATVTSAWPRSRSAVRAKMLRKSSSTTRIFIPSMALDLRGLAACGRRLVPRSSAAGDRGRAEPARLRTARRRAARRQVDGEGAALARRAGHGDLAAEQADQLAADREAEARAAVEARGACRRPARTPRRSAAAALRRCRCRCR